MKEIRWKGNSLDDIRAFDASTRQIAGHELLRVQMGLDPVDWKPMPTVGPGVKEIRIHTGNEHRILYIAKFAEAIYVLHAFAKKGQRTEKRDLDLAKTRLREVIQERGGTK